MPFLSPHASDASTNPLSSVMLLELPWASLLNVYLTFGIIYIWQTLAFWFNNTAFAARSFSLMKYNVWILPSLSLIQKHYSQLSMLGSHFASKAVCEGSMPITDCFLLSQSPLQLNQPLKCKSSSHGIFEY